MGIPTNEQNLAPGADSINDLTRVEQRFQYAAISTIATTVVKSGSGFIHEILVPGGTIGAVTVYDNTAASGTVIVPTVTPVQGGVLIRDVEFFTGLTIVTAAATVVTVSYR